MFRKLFPLFIIQFFTWVAMFALWIYTTPLLLKYFQVNGATLEDNVNDVIFYVGMLFATYSLIAGVLAFFLLKLYKYFNYYFLHACCLLTGSAGFLILYYFQHLSMLIVSFILIGICWAGVSNLPYKIVGDLAPENKEEIYFTTFNLSVIIPQIAASFLLNFFVYKFFKGEIKFIFLLGSICMLLAALFCVRQWLKKT